jgi:nucleoside recognition membrane protein YjiH
VVLAKKANLRVRFFVARFLFLSFECEQLVILFLVFPVILESRNPAVFGFPLMSWRFAHTRPKGNQRLFPLYSL